MVLAGRCAVLRPALLEVLLAGPHVEVHDVEEFDAEATLEEKAALDVVRMLFETIKMMEKRGLAKIDFLDDLLSSPTLMTWSKIAPRSARLSRQGERARLEPMA